jgi:methylated-DNA-[protein]-cysteine S-methyltransferase
MGDPIHIAYCTSPLGELQIHASRAGVHAITFMQVQHDPCLAAMKLATLKANSQRQADVVGSYGGAQHINSAEPFRLLQLQSDAQTVPLLRETAPLLRETAHQLQQYFAGERRSFDVPLAAHGTAFAQQVWAQLRQIPWGHTCSYGELARQLGNKNAMRAVGAANGRNPIAIIVPCHRVIGADGRMTGYAGGLNRKLWLLQHELACT